MRRILCATVALAAVVAPSTAEAKTGCRTRACLKRVCRSQACHRRVWRKQHPEATTSVAPALRRIRMCESGGNYRAIDPTGTYTGGYQFDDATWKSVGGSGRAYNASPAEQDRRAATLYRERGSAPWPVCGA